MKTLLLMIVFAIVSYADALIYLSNNPDKQNLQSLYQKYKQKLLIDRDNIYLIPSSCKLQRHFSGASEGKLNKIEVPAHTDEIAPTQEIFEAKSKTDIIEKIEIEKSIAIVEGKKAKAFLEDTQGRGFGGVSENPLDFTFQQVEAKKPYIKKTITKDNPPRTKSKEKKPEHPSCKLLDDGSGYKLIGIKDAKLYDEDKFSKLSDKIIYFK